MIGIMHFGLPAAFAQQLFQPADASLAIAVLVGMALAAFGLVTVADGDSREIKPETRDNLRKSA